MVTLDRSSRYSRGVDVALPPCGLWIDGASRPAAGGETLITAEPASGHELARVSAAGPHDVDRAVAAARRAYLEAWAPMGPDERARLLRGVAALIDERAEQLACLESADTGKPIRDARGEVGEAAAWLRFYADAG